MLCKPILANYATVYLASVPSSMREDLACITRIYWFQPPFRWFSWQPLTIVDDHFEQKKKKKHRNFFPFPLFWQLFKMRQLLERLGAQFIKFYSVAWFSRTCRFSRRPWQNSSNVSVYPVGVDSMFGGRTHEVLNSLSPHRRYVTNFTRQCESH